MDNMITIYDKKATEEELRTNGLGILNECISCEIEEHLNGLYQLTLVYPLFTNKASYLVEENIIKANGQLFRIYNKTTNESKIKVTALHIFYDLLNNILLDVRPDTKTASEALKYIIDNTLVKTGFTTDSNIATVNSAYYIRKNPVEAILSTDQNSFISRWGGEIKRDNFHITMKEHLGQDTGYTIRYRKNLVGIEEDIDTSTIATRIVPTCLNTINNTVIELPEKFIDSPLIGNYSHVYIKNY